MKPSPFSYHRADSVEHALTLLAELEDAKVLAGGQSLMPMMNFRYVTPEGGTVGPGDSPIDVLEDGGLGQDQYYTVRARWDLNELVMSSESIRVINESQDIVKLRDKVLSDVTQLYFERRRVQVDMLLSPSDDLQSQVKDQIRLMELTASIDAYTGGRFTESLAR